ncbi:tetratricopeptide repeat protein [Aquimarina sp. RZ0]|uniref:tetratricopeptide repeat-containing sensor histidine kinase n=1 Tax=Aquimarina sp. RZ0 TaxID=2607730 RepID=UPI0011F2D65E|nr:tetratricopeptide repeat protein [Aquimarina sp. RZ0]KAA1247217.1 tetratricopeptide repeat protein [Aquimarina sp. RZ0]KAA1247224.1 tetratricopeptide repeat protein [Aquimarina sp. RZ0]
MFCQETNYRYEELEKRLKNINELNYDDFYPLVKSILANKKEHVKALNYLGRYFMEKEIPDSTICYGNKIYEMSINKKDSSSYAMLSKAYNMLAVGYGHKGLTDIRGKYHLKGLELHEKGYVGKEVSVHHIRGLADYYTDKKEYDKAIPLYEKSIAIDKNNHTVYFAYNNLGYIYSKTKQYDKALMYLQKACSAPIEHKARGYCYESISACYLDMGELDKAIEYGLLAKTNFGNSNSNSKFILLSEITIGKSYHQKKMYTKAISIYKNTLKKVRSKGFIDIEIEVLENLNTSFIAQRNYQEAHATIIQVVRLKDSLVKTQRDKESRELEVKFQILQKEKEIELLKKDQQLKENQLVSEKENKQMMSIAFLIVLIPSIFLLIVYYQKLTAKNKLSKKQEEISIEKINSLIREQELKLIRASLKIQNKERKRIAQELHDSIGGNLAAIKLQFDGAKVQDDEFNVIKNQINETYQLIREISHDLMPEKFYHNKFTNVISEYLNNVGKAHNLAIVFNAFPPDDVNSIKGKIQVEIFRIIQELLTNTLKHAKATKIDVQINLLNKTIHIMFEDNGNGFNINSSTGGIGLQNIEDRLEKFDGKLQIDSVVSRGTILTIEIKNVQVKPSFV